MNKKYSIGLILISVAFIMLVFIYIYHVKVETPESHHALKKTTNSLRTRSLVYQLRSFEQDDGSFQDDPAGNIRLEGQVIDHEDREVGQALVSIDTHPRRTVVTEADGSFVFKGLAPRVYWIEANREGFVAGPGRWKVSANQDPVILRLRKGATIDITVLEQLSRKPVSNAQVELNSFVLHEARTTRAGNARLMGVAPGSYYLTVRAMNYAPDTVLIRVDEADLILQETVELQHGATVSGRVVDRQGNPVVAAQVVPQPLSADTHFMGVTSDAHGNWRVPNVAAGTYHLVATQEQMAPAMSEPITVDGIKDQSGVTIVMEQTGQVQGQVLSLNGQPAACAIVRIALPTWESITQHPRQAHCDDQGKVLITGLPHGTVFLVAEHALATSSTIPVDLAQKNRQSVKITLDQDQLISGIIVDHLGTPQAQIQVNAIPDRFRTSEYWELQTIRKDSLEAFTDAGGSFTFHGLSRGTYKLYVNEFGERFNPLQKPDAVASSGNRTVRLVLPGFGSVKGRARFSDGHAPQRFHIRAGQREAFNLAQGAFTLTRIPSTQRSITISGPDFVTRLVSIQIKPNQEVDVGTIIVESGRIIQGWVRTVQGEPVDGAEVFAGGVFNSGGRRLPQRKYMDFIFGIRRSVSDIEGHFQLIGLEKKTVTIAADHPVAGVSIPQSIPAEEEKPAELVLLPTSTLEGYITINGHPIKAIVRATQQQPSNQSYSPVDYTLYTKPDGFYCFERLPPGKYQLVASRYLSLGSVAYKKKTTVLLQTGTTRRDVNLPDGSTLIVTLSGEGIKKLISVVLSSVPIHAKDIVEYLHQIRDLSPSQFLMLQPLFFSEIQFLDVPPGTHTLCASGRPGVTCEKVSITDKTEIQRLELNVPRPSP